MFKYIRGWYDPKKLIPNPLRGSKSPLIWRFIEFLMSKKFVRKISPYSGIKIVFFLNGPKPIQAGHLFTHSISAKPQQRPKNPWLSPLLTNFGKKSLSLHLRWFESLFSYFFALILFTLTLATIFFCKFFVKSLKSGERLKVKFCSSEMVKIGRGQHNYRRCRCRRRHHLQCFVMMKTTVQSDQQGCLEKFQKN